MEIYNDGPKLLFSRNIMVFLDSSASLAIQVTLYQITS